MIHMHRHRWYRDAYSRHAQLLVSCQVVTYLSMCLALCGHLRYCHVPSSGLHKSMVHNTIQCMYLHEQRFWYQGKGLKCALVWVYVVS